MSKYLTRLTNLPTFFKLLRYDVLETRLCGKKEIEAEEMFKMTKFCCDKQIEDWFKEIFTGFDQKMRSKYLRFVWGRDKLPSIGNYYDQDSGLFPVHRVIKVEHENSDQRLPVGHTCFFSIDIPSYSSIVIMKERLEYAINNCLSIDTDFNA